MPQLVFWRARGETKRTIESPGRELDRQLAERIAKGDREALALLLDRHLGAVYGYLVRRLGPGREEVAADITRATFETALRRLRPYARGTASIPMQLWLLREAGKELARRKGSLKSADISAGESLQLTKLRKLLDTLPPRKGAVLSLALFEDMPSQEIAAASGLSVSRAMRLLRESLKQASVALEPEAHGEASRDG